MAGVAGFEPTNDGVIVRRALHQALIVFEKVILMIAHDAHGVGQRKQKVGKTDALRALVDEVAQNIEGVPFAKFDFLQQTAYDAVTAVRIGKTVLHDKIIPHSRTFDKMNDRTKCDSFRISFQHILMMRGGGQNVRRRAVILK